MIFRTVLPPERAPFSLSPQRPAVLLGSCFSDNMASIMRASLWNACNPLGTLYNPLSIASALSLALLPAGQGEGVFRSSLSGENPCFSWLFDSKMSAFERETCVEKFLAAAAALRGSLDMAEALFVTFGTSWVYSLVSSPDFIVGNCHKQPGALFLRRRLSIEEIVDCWSDLVGTLHLRYPDLKVVFTVSPVRHLKDGFSGNARSKALLLLAAEQLASLPGCFYFPAYELINDDLRDYRFFASDLVHPSQQAVEYVWEHFRMVFLDDEGIRTLREGEALAKAAAHRPLIADEASEQKRIERLLQKIGIFAERYPGMLIPPLP